MKICTKCGEEKSLEDYHKYKASPDGRKTMCKTCSREYSRKKKAEKQEEKYKEIRKGIPFIWEGNSEDFILVEPHGNRKTDLVRNKETSEVVAKRCTGCGEILSLNYYSVRQANKTDGKESKCIQCSYERQKHYYTENPEKQLERSRKYFNKNKTSVYKYQSKWRKENRIKNGEKVKEKERINSRKYRLQRKEYYKGWKEENDSHLYAYRKKYYAENSEVKADYQRTYYYNNKEKVYFNLKRRRTREASLPFTLSTEQIAELLNIQDNMCVLSGATENLHFEHFIPLAWGSGGTTFENCYYMEGSLNSSKQATNPFKWIKLQPEDVQNKFFNQLVPMMAERNNMHVVEFTKYINECEQLYKKAKGVG